MSVTFLKVDKENKLIRCGEKEEEIDFADSQDYAFYGFLGYKARNYAAIPELGTHRNLTHKEYKDLNIDPYTDEIYLIIPVKSLLEFDWNKELEDRRVIVQLGPNSFSGAGTCSPGEGRKTTYKEEFLYFFERLHYLTECEAEYILCRFY